MTTDTLVAGGLSESDRVLKVAPSPGAHGAVLRYARPEPVDNSYPVPLFSARLSATVRRSENGWIAQVQDLGELGYGATWKSALDSLCDSVEQYLDFLRDDEPKLAPEVAHHTDYVGLLDVPRALWFASVEINAPTVE
jgi:hypothetical protein